MGLHARPYIMQSLQSLSNIAGWCGNSHVWSKEERMPPEGLQYSSWRDYSHRDKRWIKPTSRHPDWKHKKAKVALWLHNGHKPPWAGSQLAKWEAGLAMPPESVSTSVEGQEASAANEDYLDLDMCSKLCDRGRLTDVVNALSLVIRKGCHVHNNLFYRILKRCISNKDLVVGRCIHDLIIKSGYEGDAFLATHLIGLYASHGRLEEAMAVFSKVPMPSAYNWATIISAYARGGDAARAIRLYRKMRESRVQPDNRIYVAVLKACATAGDLVAGKEVHAHIIASPGKSDIFVQTGLLGMYAKCGSLEDARGVFDRLVEKDVVTWTAMIAGYAQQGMGQDALTLYRGMQQEGISPPNSVTFMCLLQACATVGVEALHEGKQLHAQIEGGGLQDDVVLGGCLVNMYAKCGSLQEARNMFDRLPDRNVVTWTAMLAAYAQQGMGQECLGLYRTMQLEGLCSPDSATFVCLLQACGSVGVGGLYEGKQLHAKIEDRGLQDDVVLGCSLVTMYIKCGSIEDARNVFDRLPKRDVVTWTAMCAGYARQGMGQEALCLYSSMQQQGLSPPDSVAFVCLLQACASVGVEALQAGKQLHAHIDNRGLQDIVDLGCSLVNMYAKCGSLEDARRVFDRLPERDVATWNAMLAGYAQQGMGHEALSLYSSMQQKVLACPNSCTFVCLLQSCAIVGGLPLGKQLHAQIEYQGMQADVVVGAALVEMYAKCGSMSDSQQVFDTMPERTIDAWGALIGGYARQGDSEVVFELLERMGLESKQPDGITFLSVLTVCSHVGLVNKGRKYFEVMKTDYGISPSVEHYTCMMDLLGRAGHLDEALQMAKTMPLPPNGLVWRALLAACQKWTNIEVAQEAFEFAMRLDEKDAASYVLMSNIYARAQMWEEAKETQARRKKCGAWKQPGECWWTDLGGVVNTFLVGGKKHP